MSDTSLLEAVCLRCRNRIESGNMRVNAISGSPSVAFYHEDCFKAMIEEMLPLEGRNPLTEVDALRERVASLEKQLKNLQRGFLNHLGITDTNNITISDE